MAGPYPVRRSYNPVFPIRITQQDDNELYTSFDFETSGEPNLIAPFKKLNPRGPGNLGFDPNSFSAGCIDPADTTNSQVLCSNDPGGVVLGTIGNAPRTICCGPGEFQTDIGVLKNTNIGERYRLQFRGRNLQCFQPYAVLPARWKYYGWNRLRPRKEGARSASGAIRAEVLLLRTTAWKIEASRKRGSRESRFRASGKRFFCSTLTAGKRPARSWSRNAGPA